METFKIEIQELLSRTLMIEADNINEALDKVQKMYTEEQIVLDYTDLTNQEIIPFQDINIKNKLIKDVIKYLYEDEQKHFEESDKPNDHIYLKLKKLESLIE